MGDTTPMTGKKLTLEFFNEQCNKVPEKVIEPSRLDHLYNQYAKLYTSEEFFIHKMRAALKGGGKEISVFLEGTEMSPNHQIGDIIGLFNEEYGKEKKPSLESLLRAKLSDQFKLKSKTIVTRDWGEDYQVLLYWD